VIALYCLCESFKEAFLCCDVSIRKPPLVLEENLHPTGILPVSWMSLVGLVERRKPQALGCLGDEEAVGPPAALLPCHSTAARPIWTLRVDVYWVDARPHLKWCAI